MPDIPFSGATQLAWQLAGDFALRSGEGFIQPRHLLYGICSVEKVAGAAPRDPEQTPADGDELRRETEQLEKLAQRHSVDLASVRRTLRETQTQAAPHSTSAASGRVVSRSPEVRKVFEDAARIAANDDLPQVDLLSLLHALLDSPDDELAAFIASSAPGFTSVSRELQAAASLNKGVMTSSIAHISDLDVDDNTIGQPLQISESIDANRTVQRPSASATERLAWLSELAWEFGTAGELESLLQKASEELLRILPQAEHNVILVRDPSDGELLLKAFSPGSWTPRVSMSSVRRAMEEKRGFIWTRGDDLTASQREIKLETGIYVPLVVNGLALGVICLDSTTEGQHLGCGELELVTCFAHQVALAVANYELRTSLKQNADVLERLLTNFSPQVRTRLLQRARMGRLALGGELSVVSILCSDIRGFTRLTANMKADDIVGMLNEYFATLVDCIFRHDGTIDKFVGDAILAVFGSPEADPKHHQKAVAAAVEMQLVMQQVSDRRVARGEVACQLGIGVHSGEVLHGFIGSVERMEFTVIGEAVNLAARYSDGAKGSEVLISPEMYQRVWTSFPAEKVTISTKHEGDLVAYRVTAAKLKAEKAIDGH